MIIGIDVFGGDNSPEEIIKAVKKVELENNTKLVLYGDKDIISNHLDSDKYNIVDTKVFVSGEDKPVDAVRKKKGSSMMLGLSHLKEGKINGFLSAGNTGALLAGSIFLTGRIKSISRPALATPFPTKDGIKLLLDAGANVDVTPENIVDFAKMGSLYQSKVIGTNNPRVAIINNGEEEGKGNSLVKSSIKLLEKEKINFTGSIEGRDIPFGKADVFLCDGFVGNVILKVTEGLAAFFMESLKGIFLKNILTKLSALAIKSGLKSFKKLVDYKEYGGAPLLGIDSYVVKAHGSSDEKAFVSAIKFLEKYIKSDIIKEIRKSND